LPNLRLRLEQTILGGLKDILAYVYYTILLDLE
jgi:hypothetical protein